MSKKRVLFLCTGNSCRSQMAEAIVRHYMGDEWQAYSAGTEPDGHVHPLAIRVMSELGIDITDQRSKSAHEVHGIPFDLVVTVCDHAAQNCPLWLGEGHRVHVSFQDPASATGSTEARLDVFRQVRDDIRRRILLLLQSDATT
jgi:arsenate reductase